MKNRFLFPVTLFCVAMAVLAGSLAAQVHEPFATGSGLFKNQRIGTAAATELLIPVGARDVAMAGASMASSIGVEALHWNPAGLGRMSGSAEGLFSSMAYIADIRVNYGAVGINFGGFGAVALSIKALSFGDIPLTTVDDPEGIAGRTFSPSFVVLGFSYARAFTDAITAGGTIKLISENMQRVTGSGVAIDMGVQYHGVANVKGLNLGVALKNVGPQVNFDGTGLLRLAKAENGKRPTQYYQSKAASWELPSSAEIGMTYQRQLNEEISYSINGTFTNNNLALDGYKIGGEVAYSMGSLKVAGRGGIELLNKGAADEQIFGPAVGVGFTYETPGMDITIDYAYRTVDFFDNNNMFSVKLSF